MDLNIYGTDTKDCLPKNASELVEQTSNAMIPIFMKHYPSTTWCPLYLSFLLHTIFSWRGLERGGGSSTACEWATIDSMGRLGSGSWASSTSQMPLGSQQIT